MNCKSRVLIDAILLAAVFCPILGMADEEMKSSSSLKAAKEAELQTSVRNALEGLFSNYIAMGSGQLRDGEQIPVPVYRDGTPAKRSECHYIAAPAEVPTYLTSVTTAGAFYIKSSADREGYVHASVWQMSGTGEGVKLLDSNTVRLMTEQSEVPGITSTIGKNDVAAVLAQQMKWLSEHLVVNYFVAAIRSSKE